MIRLGTNRYFFYNDINHSYDLVWFQQVDSELIDDIVFNVDLTRFDKVFDEPESQSSTYQSAVQLHQAFEAYNWIRSPEVLEAYGDFSDVIENASFGNLSTDTKTDEVKAMINQEIYTLSDNIPLDHRNNQILSYPYYRLNGSGAFIQVSYPIYDLFVMGATLIFYEVTPDLFKPIDYDSYQYDSVSDFVNINPNFIVVSQYWGSPKDIYQLAIPTLNPSTGVQEVRFILYDNSQIFHYQSIPYSTYKDMPAKANFQNYNDYYMKYKN